MRSPRSALAALSGIVALFVSVFGSVPASAAPTSTARSEAGPVEPLAASLDRFLHEAGAPGGAVAVVDAAGVVTSAVQGEDGDGREVGDDTPFVWGSVSKAVTAAVVEHLISGAELDRSDRVVSVLPAAAAVLDDDATTIGDLLDHTSGVAQDISRTDQWDRRGSALDALPALAGVDQAERGTFRYSSLNYLLLQAVVEDVTRGSFAQALADELPGAFGADPSGLAMTPQDFLSRVPAGTVPFFGGALRREIGIDEAGLGYGYLAGSVDQLGTFVSRQLRSMQAGASAVAVGVPTGGSLRYRDGWYQQPGVDGTTEMLWHSGAVPGYFSHVALVPDLGLGIVLLTNRYGELEAEHTAALAQELVDRQLPGARSRGAPHGGVEDGDRGLILGIGILLGMLFVGWAVLAVRGTVRGRRSVRVSGTVLGRRTVETRRRGALVEALCAAVVVLGILVGTPPVLGLGWHQIWRWAPDVVVLLGILGTASAAVTCAALLRLRGASHAGRA